MAEENKSNNPFFGGETGKEQPFVITPSSASANASQRVQNAPPRPAPTTQFSPASNAPKTASNFASSPIVSSSANVGSPLSTPFENNKFNNGRKWLWRIIIVLIIASFIDGGIFFWWRQPKNTIETPTPQASEPLATIPQVSWRVSSLSDNLSILRTAPIVP